MVLTKAGPPRLIDVVCQYGGDDFPPQPMAFDITGMGLVHLGREISHQRFA